MVTYMERAKPHDFKKYDFSKQLNLFSSLPFQKLLHIRNIISKNGKIASFSVFQFSQPIAEMFMALRLSIRKTTGVEKEVKRKVQEGKMS